MSICQCVKLVKKKNECKKCKKSVFNPKKMYRNGIVYAFTLNFNDGNQYFDDRSRRIHMCYESVKKSVAILSRYGKVVLYPEFSTPSAEACLPRKKSRQLFRIHTAPRFHLHGTVTFNKVAEWYCGGFGELLEIGIFEIDTIDDMSIWKKYILKDREVMERYVKSYHYPYKVTTDSAKRIGKIKNNAKIEFDP